MQDLNELREKIEKSENREILKKAALKLIDKIEFYKKIGREDLVKRRLEALERLIKFMRL